MKKKSGIMKSGLEAMPVFLLDDLLILDLDDPSVCSKGQTALHRECRNALVLVFSRNG